MPGLLNSKNRSKKKHGQRAETEPDTVDEAAEGVEDEEDTAEGEMPEEEAEEMPEDEEESASAQAGAQAERSRVKKIHAFARNLGMALDSAEVVDCVDRGLGLEASYEKIGAAAGRTKPKPKAAPAGPSRMASAATTTAARVTPSMGGNGAGGAMPQPATFNEAIVELQEEANLSGQPITRARAARLAADRYPDLYRSGNEAAHRKMPRGAKDPSG